MNRRQTELEGRKRREREKRKKGACQSLTVCDYTEQARSEDTAAVDKISAQWQ